MDDTDNEKKEVNQEKDTTKALLNQKADEQRRWLEAIQDCVYE